MGLFDAVGSYLGDVMSGEYARQGLAGLMGYRWNPELSALDNARALWRR